MTTSLTKEINIADKIKSRSDGDYYDVGYYRGLVTAREIVYKMIEEKRKKEEVSVFDIGWNDALDKLKEEI